MNKLIGTLLFCAVAGLGQTVYTTPGNGVDIRAIIYYTNGRPCVSCTLQWSTVPPTTQGVNAGYHYHSAGGAPSGTITHADSVSDAGGYGNCQWTSKLTDDELGYPLGYASQYTVQVCSPQAANVCVIVPIRTYYAGLSQATPSVGWVKTTDSGHNTLQYAFTSFFTQEIALIASKFYKASGGKTLLLVRGSLPVGGIYDGWMNQAYWLFSYAGKTAGENHMYGDEADFSLAGMTNIDVENLFAAVDSTLELDGIHTCEIWPGVNGLAHVYCGGSPD